MYYLLLSISLLFFSAQLIICIALLSRAVSKKFLRKHTYLLWTIISLIILFAFAWPLIGTYTTEESSDVFPGLAYIFLPLYGAVIMFGCAAVTVVSFIVRKVMMNR